MTHKQIKTLIEFERTCDPAAFENIFGGMYAHLWNKFSNLKHSLLDFYSSLDEENQRLFINYLNNIDNGAY